jgi:hypothetical protein
MSFDDAEEERLDALVSERFEDTTLEQLERQMAKNFGTTEVTEMPEGMVKRAIVMARFNRLMDVAMPLTENLEQAPQLWATYGPPPAIEMGRSLER